jgi:soluble lytic murein transglycosylase
MFRSTLLALGLCLGLSAPVGAQSPDGDASISGAFAAADAGDWDLAYALAGENAMAHDLLTWTRLRATFSDTDTRPPFADYAAFVPKRRDWPGMDRLRARGEEVMPPDLPPQTVVDWFGGSKPETGQGAVRLHAAMAALGDRAGADAMVATIWTEDTLTDDGHAAMLAAFPDLLAPLNAARAEAMLWRWRTSDAERMLPLLSEGDAALTSARIALIRKSGNAQTRFDAVPSPQKDDPGLAYDRYNYLADRGDYSAAIDILLARSTSATALGQPFRWSGWRRALARWDMREGRYDRAYRVATNHFLTATDGEAFADLEWLAGYLSLRYLDKPEQALGHFQTLDAAVDSPISAGRAGYWLGRTYMALGRTDDATAAYGRAAEFQTAFYGLLAAEKLGRSIDPALTGQETFPAWQAADFLGTDTARAAFTLLAADERGSAVLFFAELGKTLDRTSLGQLGQLLDDMNEPFFQVLIGKSAAARGIILPATYFPIHDLAYKDIPVSAELALAIARRESEFNPVVGSGVGALGLMQLMPGTAEEIAGELGLPYSKARLTADWDYNATLGAKYLADLQDRFGHSPVYIAAGYNAGPSRPAQWIDEQGDPRLGQVDVIDWIELIPFTETRNYVQRVSESIPVYQARLSGQAGPIRFTDLLRGEKPIIRPQARPDPVSVSLRPLARPDVRSASGE